MRKPSRKPAAVALGVGLAVGGATASASMVPATDPGLSAAQRELLVQKAAEDPDFRQRLLRDPVAAARELNILLSQAGQARILEGMAGIRRGMELAAYPLPKITGSPDTGSKKEKKNEKGRQRNMPKDVG